MFFLISTDFTPTPGIPVSPLELHSYSSQCGPTVELWSFTPGLYNRLRALTPNDSEQRSPHTCYRGCWHVIGRGLFLPYRHHTGIASCAYSSDRKGLYNLPAFITHVASLRQTFVHCGRFLAAASRRSLGRISVPVWPLTLSGRLLIVALVGHYPTN